MSWSGIIWHSTLLSQGWSIPNIDSFKTNVDDKNILIKLNIDSLVLVKNIAYFTLSFALTIMINSLHFNQSGFLSPTNFYRNWFVNFLTSYYQRNGSRKREIMITKSIMQKCRFFGNDQVSMSSQNFFP